MLVLNELPAIRAGSSWPGISRSLGGRQMTSLRLTSSQIETKRHDTITIKSTCVFVTGDPNIP
jgi:hypothetical protein